MRVRYGRIRAGLAFPGISQTELLYLGGVVTSAAPKSMRQPARAFLFSLLLCAAGSALAQGASDFYLGLLRRGTSFVEAGQYAPAVTPLRIAAFGLVESVERYETALVYLAITQDRLGNQDDARDSLRRLLAAERVERRFSSLALPAAIRGSFDGVSKKYLSPAELSALAATTAAAQEPRTPPVSPRPAPQNSAQDRTTQRPATTQTTKPEPQTTKPAPAPATTRPAPTTTRPAPTTTTPTTTTVAPPQTKPEAKPATRLVETKPLETKPVVAKPVETKPAPTPTRPQPSTATPPPPAVKQPAPQPAATQATTPAAPQAPAKPRLSAKEIASRLAEADRALANGQLPEARRLYREVLESPALDRESTLRVAEGFYRARDFVGALAAFKVLGATKRGEEPYGYYQAVSLYETGAYDAAKKALAAAIPFIEMTPDVVRYRAKIEGAR